MAEDDLQSWAKPLVCLQVYKEYRNFMINKYREDVKRRLLFTECKKLLAGMASMLLTVCVLGAMYCLFWDSAGT